MLIPMPPLWLADAALIAADRFRMPELGFVNVPVQVCGTARLGIGLHTALDLPMRRMRAFLAACVVYVQARRGWCADRPLQNLTEAADDICQGG